MQVLWTKTPEYAASFHNENHIEYPQSSDDENPLLPVNAKSSLTSSKKKRFSFIDSLRGFTALMMIMVDFAGPAFNYSIAHAPWDGFSLADFVMPSFLFLVGFSITLSTKRLHDSKYIITLNLLKRSIKLFLLGLFLNGGNYPSEYHDYQLTSLRYFGILQRIAFVYLITSLTDVWIPKLKSFKGMLKFSYHYIIMMIIVVIYLLLTFNTNVPGCGKGLLTPECNSHRYWDIYVAGSDNHLYGLPEYIRMPECSSCSPGNCPIEDRPDWCDESFDQQGIVSSFGAVNSGLMGLIAGNTMKFKMDVSSKVRYWFIFGAGSFFYSFLLVSTGLPINKNLYTPSFVALNWGIDFWLLAIFLALVELKQRYIKTILYVFEAVGKNSILIFVFCTSGYFDEILQWVYYKDEKENIVTFTENNLKRVFGLDFGLITFTILKVLFWSLVCVFLDKKKR
ncbi:hypothetical protein HDU92_005504 [Lobulomyces angularis]|nr:hypothetical protein HDU92_005504 [Lobulomyces angularis]